MAARSTTCVSMIIFLVFSCFISSMESRKLLQNELHETKKSAASLPADRLYKNALPKGTVPASSPSKKGHAENVDEKLIARHLAALDRILRSVPSPGIGN